MAVSVRQEAHEVKCTERWREAKDTWDRVEKSLLAISLATQRDNKESRDNSRSSNRLVLNSMGTAIIILLGALATVLWHLVTLKP